MRFEPELALSPPVNQSAVTFAPNRKTRDSEELELISFFLVRTAGLELVTRRLLKAKRFFDRA
jgi:hypothetical protein